MATLLNENILTLVFNSLRLEYNQLLKKLNNAAVSKAILRVLNYKSIFKSIGKNKTILKAHNSMIYSLSLLPNDHIVSASWDRTIKIWDINNKTCIKTISDEASVRSVILFPNGYLASCSNKAIKLYDIKDDYKYIKTLNFEKYTLFNKIIKLSNGNLACTAFSERKQYILILDSNDYKLINTMLEDKGWIYSLIHFNDNKFASGTEYSAINLWDINVSDNKCVASLTGHGHRVLSLLYFQKENLLLSGSSDQTIKTWDLNNYECVRTIQADKYNGISSLLLLPNGYFASGSYDHFIKIWQLGDFQCLNSLKDKNTVSCLLLLKGNRIVSATHDGHLTIWDY
jgi:WD40 repeat protein